MERFLPDVYSQNIYKVNYDKLKDKGIKCLLFDLDNTIVPFSVKKPTLDTIELFTKLKEKEFKIIIFSNSPKFRLKRFKNSLNVDVFGNARKPHKKNFIEILKKYHYTESEVAIIGDQLLTDIIGGNNVGITTVLTTPLDKDPIWTKINRIREKNIMKKLKENNLFIKEKYYD